MKFFPVPCTRIQKQRLNSFCLTQNNLFVAGKCNSWCSSKGLAGYISQITGHTIYVRTASASACVWSKMNSTAMTLSQHPQDTA